MTVPDPHILAWMFDIPRQCKVIFLPTSQAVLHPLKAKDGDTSHREESPTEISHLHMTTDPGDSSTQASIPLS